MGACCSNRIKAESPSNTEVNSTNVSRDKRSLSNSSGKVSSFSLPQTPRSEGEILQSSNLKNISFSNLRTATRNFRPDGVLGEGGSHFQPLSWSLRMKITLGAAKGLTFLYSAEPKVIYCDFKTSNILLDSVNYNAKLSDFGLARDEPTGDKSHVSTKVMGTYGYTAPEYLATCHLTTKSDIYSFGVVLLEMLSGRRAIDKNQPSGEHNLVEWAKPYQINKRRIFRVLDPRLEGQFSLPLAQKAATLALQCLSMEAKFRPDMDEVVKEIQQLQEMKKMPRST